MAADPVAICHRCPHRGALVGRSIVCGGDAKGLDIVQRAAAWDCPKGLFPSRGLGDTVAKVIKAATMGAVKPCEPCARRQAALNRLLSYGRPD